MKGLSKSKYTKFCQCDKNLWLSVYKPEEEVIDDATKARFESGNEVGDLAMVLLGDFVEVTTKRADGGLDLTAMIQKTQECISNGTENICEASFTYEGNYCAVDILHKTDNGYSIYEVKSTTWRPEKEEDKKHYYGKYATDIAYQKWVLTQCGINVTGTFLVLLDGTYKRHGELSVKDLFYVMDLSELVENEYMKVPTRVIKAMKVVNQTEEPDTDFSTSCKKPYDCGFMQYCKRQKCIPYPSVFDLYRGIFEKEVRMYKNGHIDFKDLVNDPLTAIQQIQVACTLNGTTSIDKAGIKRFLSTLSYPLYFLDFETMQPVLPPFDGTHPYQQIPFQYSLHIIENEGGELVHMEFLGESGTDTRRALAEQLCRDIPMNVCTLAYNKKFECSRIKEMADAFPDLASHLMNISNNIRDLLDPFQQGYYYAPAMNGSFSIKKVLPALFPDDPTLDYHNLDEQVQNGGDAMNIFPRIKDMSPAEQVSAREALLRYCELDTLAMVKVWERLREVSEE